MSKKKRIIIEDDDGEPTAPFWMSTFSDMATLLLTFFILIVAMSEVEVQKFKEALSYFQGRPSYMTYDAVIPPVQKQTTSFDSVEQARRFEELLDYLEHAGLEDKVKVNLTERGLHVVVTDEVMFESGAATLIEPARTILKMLAGILDRGVGSVVVEGHTDNRPINTAQYPSNWELSGARAASVVRFLLEQPDALAPDRYTATGYGEHHPIDTNDTPEGRARNRRVEILFASSSWQPQTQPILKPASTP